MSTSDGRVYPLPRPETDPRFTFGLTLEIAKELEKRGYPKISGLDFVDLQQAIFGFLYARSETFHVETGEVISTLNHEVEPGRNADAG